ncbi:MAG: FlaD/FlaE family flagellar protein [Thermoplasmata archaeon]
MAPLFRKKEETAKPQERIEKPTEGICAKCGSTKLSFFDDGTGKCNNCGRVFNWKAVLSQTPPEQSSQPQSQTLTGQFAEVPAPAEQPPPIETVEPSTTPPTETPPSIQPQIQTSTIETLPPPPPPPEATPQPIQPIVTPSIQTEGGFRRSERIEEALAELKTHVERINDTNERYRLEINEIKESIARIESRLHELTALYDAISAQFNPFIDIQIKKETDGGTAQTAEKIGEELSEAVILDKVACPKCGELIPEDAKTCPKCGASLELAPIQSTPQIEIPQMPQQSMIFQQPQQSQFRNTPLLQSIGTDYRSSLLAMRWIEYLLDKVDLNELPQVLDYYRRINWISNEVKADILWKIKGIKIEKKPTKPETKDGWRLSINDHLKNLMFIEMLRGTQLDKLTLEELEKEMEKLKKSNLEDFYGL